MTPAALITLPDHVIDEEFRRIVDELTRRGFLAGGLAAATALGLAACSTDSSAPAPSATTRLVDSVHGKIRVPEHPRRVVTLDGFTMAALLDLGIKPAGVYSAGEQYVEPQFVKRWRVIPKISDGTVGGAIELEKVAALKPDLILGIDGQKPPYAQLTGIAPTVILPFNASAAPWRDMAKDTAVAIGERGVFTAEQKKYATRAASIRTQYASLLSRLRWDVLQGGFDAGQFWLYGEHSPVGGILADAGVHFATASASVGADGQQNLSYEEISRLHNADAIFSYTTNTGTPANLGPKLVAQPLWGTLPAVTAGHFYGTIYFLPQGYSDAFGVLDALEDALKKIGESK